MLSWHFLARFGPNFAPTSWGQTFLSVHSWNLFGCVVGWGGLVSMTHEQSHVRKKMGEGEGERETERIPPSLLMNEGGGCGKRILLLSIQAWKAI